MRGYDSVSIKRELGARVDAFIEDNEWGFTSRGSVVAAALRQFLNQEASPEEAFRAFLRDTLQAVALTEPKDVPALLQAMLAELDVQTSTPSDKGRPSKTESTKRQ